MTDGPGIQSGTNASGPQAQDPGPRTQDRLHLPKIHVPNWHLHRRLRSLAYRQVVYLDVHYAEYQSRCHCCKFFRSWPLEVPAKSDYDA